MPVKKKVVKKKIVKRPAKKAGQTISQTVNIHLAQKSKTKSGGRSKKTPSGTPLENRISSGYILQGAPIQPSYQPQFTKTEDRQLLIEDLKRQFPLLTYKPSQSQPMITDGSDFFQPSEQITAPIIQEQSETFSQSQPSESYQIPESVPIVRRPVGKTEEEKTAISTDKLKQYGFPPRIAQKGSTARDDDITQIVDIMYKANREQNANITAADLKRVYGIDGESVKKRLQEKTGMISVRRKKESKIPSLSDFNIV